MFSNSACHCLLGLAVGVRESCTVCQQAFSALAKDSASHPYPKGSNTTMLVHSGVLL